MFFGETALLEFGDAVGGFSGLFERFVAGEE